MIIQGFLLFSSATSAVWLHSEQFTILSDKTSNIQYLAAKVGNINPVSVSSCGTSAGNCLINIPSDVTVGLEQPFLGLAAMHQSPLNGSTLNLAGDLVPSINGRKATGYIAQLVFSAESSCSDMSKLSQINVHPVFETCTQFVDGFYTITTMEVANGIPVAVDKYCNDAACSSNCIYGVTWNMPSNCSAVPRSGNLFSYYLPIVRPSGLTVLGVNQTTPTASSTVPAPTPTDIYNGAVGAFHALDYLSLFFALVNVF